MENLAEGSREFVVALCFSFIFLFAFISLFYYPLEILVFLPPLLPYTNNNSMSTFPSLSVFDFHFSSNFYLWRSSLIFAVYIFYAIFLSLEFYYLAFDQE